MDIPAKKDDDATSSQILESNPGPLGGKCERYLGAMLARLYFDVWFYSKQLLLLDYLILYSSKFDTEF